MCGSIPVLKKYKLSGPLPSGATSSPRELWAFGISLTKGTTLPKNSIKRRTPISFPPHTQNTGNILRVIKPLRIPKRISSSESVSCSKNFSIRLSSFSAAASTNALWNSIAFSFSSSGISSITGSPPSGFQLYFFISNTSIKLLKSGPVCNGYCTGTHLLP